MRPRSSWRGTRRLPDAADRGIMERFSNKMAIAPTASISIITGNASPGIEPYAANVFTQKTLSGSFPVRNKYLKQVLAEKGRTRPRSGRAITTHEGSVQHLDFLDEAEKLVFKTAYEMDQRWVVEHAGDPRAVHLPGAVGQCLPAGQHPQARFAHAALFSLEEGREVALLLPFRVAAAPPTRSPRKCRRSSWR